VPKVRLSTGIDCFFEQVGTGPPLVLIPGTSMGHDVWALQLPVLAPSYSVIAMDPRGAGQTDAPVEPQSYSAAQMADDVAALLDVIGIKEAHVAGLSLGSAIAQEFALRHQDRTLSIQLHATWGRSDAWFRQVFVNPMLHFLEAGNLHLLFKFGQGMIMSPAYLEKRGPPIVAEMVTRCLVKNPYLATAAGLRGQLHADATHDSLDRLADIRVPTLVTAGELDANTPERYGREVHALIPAAKFHYFQGPRSSHCALWEMADEFNAVVHSFLNALPSDKRKGA
jgi:pimeloyl-ACP methyl ester carboxylesterase